MGSPWIHCSQRHQPHIQLIIINPSRVCYPQPATIRSLLLLFRLRFTRVVDASAILVLVLVQQHHLYQNVLNVQAVIVGSSNRVLRQVYVTDMAGRSHEPGGGRWINNFCTMSMTDGLLMCLLNNSSSSSTITITVLKEREREIWWWLLK